MSDGFITVMDFKNERTPLQQREYKNPILSTNFVAQTTGVLTSKREYVRERSEGLTRTHKIALCSAASILLFSMVAFSSRAPTAADDASGRWGAPLADDAAPPTPPSDYYAKIVMVMPYIGMEEPIEVWTDAAKGVQRVSYWEGLDVFYLNATGKSCEIIPISFDGVSGREQPVSLPAWKSFHWFPDLALFHKLTDEVVTIRGHDCDVWYRQELDYDVDGNFVGDYYYYADAATGEAVRFTMLGHNAVTGSHFDNYTWEYLEIVAGAQPAAAFEQPASCPDAPHLQGDDVDDGAPPVPTLYGFDEAPHAHLHDAMMMLPGARARALRAREYGAWADAAGRNASARGADRAGNYRHSRRYVNAMNRRTDLTFTLGLNEMADWTDEERARGRLGLLQARASI